MNKIACTDLHNNEGRPTIILEEISPLISAVLLSGCAVLLVLGLYFIKYSWCYGLVASDLTVGLLGAMLTVLVFALYCIKALFHHFVQTNIHVAAFSAWSKVHVTPLWIMAATLILGFYIFGLVWHF